MPTRVAVRRQSVLATFLARKWLSGWLKAAREMLEGPLLRVGSSLPNQSKVPLRPIEIVVPETSTLTTTLRMPKEAVLDLPYAIDLMIHRETPFEPAELLVHADEIASGGPQEVAFFVRMLPRSRLDAIIGDSQVSRRQIARLTLETEQPPGAAVDVTRLLHGRFDWRGWASLLPLVLCLGICLHMWVAEMDVRTARIAALRDMAAAALSRLAVATHQREDLMAHQKAVDTTLSLLDKPATAYERLIALSRIVPADAQISRIDFKNDVLRLFLRSNDLLADIQSMNSSSGWTISLDGPLTTDASSGAELASVIVSQDRPEPTP